MRAAQDAGVSHVWRIVANWYQQGQLNLDSMVSRTISLDQTEEAFAAMQRGETLRSVIVFAA